MPSERSAAIMSTLARLTGTRLLFMDTCHAGNVTGTATRGVPDLRQFLQDLKDGGQGLVVITSSRPGQQSQEHPSWNNGAFTKALVEGLKGKAQKDRQGLITFTALDAYITQRVKEALGLVDIRLLDHIIVGDGASVSLAERGLL